MAYRYPDSGPVHGGALGDRSRSHRAGLRRERRPAGAQGVHLFYNVPLTLRGRMRRRAEVRSTQPARLWHVLPIAALLATILGAVQIYFNRHTGQMPALIQIWWAILLVPLLGDPSPP